MHVCGQEFDDALLARIQRVVDDEPGLSRRALSRRICHWLDWRAANGTLKAMSCRVALLKLHRRGAVRLPPATTPRHPPRRPKPAAPGAAPARQVALQDVQPVTVIRIDQATSEAARVWNDLMSRHHPLGAGPLCGAQLRYLLWSPTQGYVGGVAFSAAAWRLAARDRWIGWDETARRHYLPRVVANSRFLLLPQLQVPHLASHVLGLVLRRLRADWQARYGYQPLLVETCVEQGRHRGTCYQAANWIPVGVTQGRGRQDRAHRHALPVKQVWVYTWHPQARAQLCAGPAAPPPLAMDGPAAAADPSDTDWAITEFGGAALGDRRLAHRLVHLARDFWARPQAPIPQACQSRAKAKAAYRFFDHPRTHMETLLQPHYEATRQRVAREAVVLAVQDTTSLDYSAHPATEALGPIGTAQQAHCLGLLLHDTLAFSPEGTPLGVVDVQCWARDGRAFGKRHQRYARPIEQKESHKWLSSFHRVAALQRQCPQTTLISVGDREADLYELFQRAQQEPQGPKLLVRADRDRLLADGQGHLWPAVAAQAVAGYQDLHIPRRGARPARQVRLAVQFAAVPLQPPKRKPQLGPVRLWAIVAEEVDAPAGVEPLRWLLLTTCPVSSFEQATEKLAWYTKRWGIEVYHRTLKSGCKIEKRQLGHAERIEACLALDLVVAWRIFHLAKLSREVPDVPCTVFFEEAEWKTLTTYVRRQPDPPAQPPTLREALHMVATLGGFLGRRCDGEPGTKSLWLGLQRLDDLTAMWTFMVDHFAPHLRSPPVSSNPPYG